MTEKKAGNVQIGARVKEAREAAGLTQERLAELIDITGCLFRFYSGCALSCWSPVITF